jgi:phosphatidylinositol glycan class B
VSLDLKSNRAWLAMPHYACAAILTLAVITRGWAALKDHGCYWADEIYQTMEPAHHFAFGYGLLPWEFLDGARSWLFPGLIGVAWKLAAKLGVSSSVTLVGMAKVCMASLSVAGVWMGMCLARKLGGEAASLFAGLVGTLCTPLLVIGSRCMTETATAPLILGAALLLQTPGRGRAAWAGAMAALSIFLRYQNGILAVGFLVILLARRTWPEFRAYLSAAILVGLLGGLLDWPTWGFPFRAAWVYINFEILKGGASSYGTYPPTFYVEHLGTAIGLSFAVLVLGLAVASRRAPGLVLLVMVVVAIHSVIPHKELRFLYPVLPLGVSLASVGLVDLMNGLGKGPWPLAALATICGTQMALQDRNPTFEQFGVPEIQGVHDIWHAHEGYVRASWAAARAPELCGIIYTGTFSWATGGYTYLHRAVPIFLARGSEELDAANFLIGEPGEQLPSEWRRVGAYRGFELWERPGGCLEGQATPATHL